MIGLGKSATFSKLIVIGLLGALSLLLVEIRFEHREALGEAWQSWIPLVYCSAMLVLSAVALTRWYRGGRQVCPQKNDSPVFSILLARSRRRLNSQSFAQLQRR